MFKTLFGDMSKVRVLAFIILMVLVSVLAIVVPVTKKDAVECFFLFVAFCFFLECCFPVDETQIKNKKRKK
ncbi:TPA: hypothetical protein ACVB7O_000203 [Acinetobacter baumannii]|uniref:hypothetical protein n=1 Tax=Acinetobacter baumannii TaxID=470 RepID=UPI001CDB69F6|nr:hypothetical protein [Acinetobacter baumannii]EHU1446246.1 hypothetical protein [Acinetobacter baumannii]EHU2667443.1 hypothetical protein [Acinetobacter baumannii]EHU3276435.1 hypothetical protein [Acinetobacter baumannii]MCA4414239.1 hypothetical protein [Acinetobacter baumannii]